MPHDPILHLLGLARKAGKLELGEEPVGAACRAKQAKLMLLASDAAPNTRRRAAHFGEAGNVLFLELPFTKAELGFAMGRGFCAMLALTDSGFAASLADKLAARSPERYAPAAEQLRIKAERVLQRQREKRQHEKNLREGKKKPWVAPPSLPKKQAEPKKQSSFSGKKGSGKQTQSHHGLHSQRSAPIGRKKLTGKFRQKPE